MPFHVPLGKFLRCPTFGAVKKPGVSKSPFLTGSSSESRDLLAVL